MRTFSMVQLLSCGDIDSKEVNCEYDFHGHLLEVYFPWDKEKRCNLKLDLTQYRIEMLEREFQKQSQGADQDDLYETQRDRNLVG